MAGKNHGRFVWYDLMTSDAPAAIAFYGEVVGWKTESWHGGQYTMWSAGQGPIGGVMGTKGQTGVTMPASWTSYVAVDDAAATLAEAQKRGGRVIVPPSPIPQVGRYAFLADPQGVTIGILQPESEMKLHDFTKPGEVCWNELVTTDREAAFAFYAALFGWTRLAGFPMGDLGEYTIYGTGGVQLGGMMTKPKEAPSTTWNYYVEVEGLDGAIARATSKQAKVLSGPHPVPGGRMVHLLDPQGVPFCLHENARS